MLVEQLSTAFKCHSAIGNSNDLKEMMDEVLRTFVNETYAVYGEFYLFDEDNNYEKVNSFGRPIEFSYEQYLGNTSSIKLTEEEEKKVVTLKLDNGIIFLVTKNLNADCSFFISMFESLLPKLNLSINACLNVEKLLISNELLEIQKKKLINANKTKDDFLANMSHELKTPLNSIIILSAIMKKNKNNALQEKELKNINIINNSANDLLDLINDVLDISKIEAGRINILKKSFDIEEFVISEYEILKPLVNKDNVNFTCNFNINEKTIFSDKLRLKQILKNLLSNAIKFTTEGSIELFTKEYKDYFEITLKDTGIGIEKNKLDYIFDRFKQIETSTNRVFKGTGLGLAISKELATLLDCSLTVDSVVGKGSTFTLKVPKNQSLKLFSNLENKINQPQVILEENMKEEEIQDKVEDKVLEEKNLLLLHSNSLKLFSFTIALKKQFNVTPFDSTQRLLESLNDEANSNSIIIYNDNVSDITELEEFIKINKSSSIKFETSATIENIIDKINKNKE